MVNGITEARLLGRAALVLFAVVTMTVPSMAVGMPKDTTRMVSPTPPPTFSGRIIELPQKALRAGRDTIILAVEAPPGYHLTNEAPSSLCWFADSATVVSFPKSCKSYKTGSIHFPFKLMVDTKPGQSMLTLDANAFYCENKSKLCMFDKFRVKLPIEVSKQGVSSTTLSVELEVLNEKTP